MSLGQCPTQINLQFVKEPREVLAPREQLLQRTETVAATVQQRNMSTPSSQLNTALSPTWQWFGNKKKQDGWGRVLKILPSWKQRAAETGNQVAESESCWGRLRGHCMRLCRWSLGHGGELLMLEMPAVRFWPGELHKWSRSSEAAKPEERGRLRSLKLKFQISDFKLKYLVFDLLGLVLLWSSLFLLYPSFFHGIGNVQSMLCYVVSL